MTGKLSSSNPEQVELTEEVIKHYTDLLERVSSDNNQIHDEALSEIEKQISENFSNVALILSHIILEKDCTNIQANISLNLLKRIFTPEPPLTEDFISEKWISISQQDRNTLKDAIFKGLIFNDQQINSIAALTFSELFNIEKSDMFDSIPKLYELYEDSQSSTSTKTAVITAITEIIGPKSLGSNTDIFEVQNLLTDIFSHIETYYSECLSLPLEIRYSICKALNTFLDVAVALFESEDVVYSIIDIAIENLEKIQQTSSSSPDSNNQLKELQSEILSILKTLIKIHYNNTDFNPETIFKFIIKQILDYNDDNSNKDLVNNYINFWKILADFERQIIKRNNNKESLNEIISRSYTKKRFEYKIEPEICRNFCITVMQESQIVEKLILIIQMIDPKDIQSEDISILKPHMFATVCLQSFLKLNPHFVFESIVTHWKPVIASYHQNMIHQKSENQKVEYKPPPPMNWVVDNALITTVSIMCRKTIIKNELVRDLHTLFFEPFDDNYVVLRDFILGTCLMSSNIPKITDNCLFGLTKLIERYPEFLNENDYDIIINFIKHNKEIEDDIIFTRMAFLISVICSRKVSLYINNSIKLKISQSFDDFVELFKIGIAKENSIDNSRYKYVYNMMMNVIRFAIYSNHFMDINNDDKIASIIKSQIDIINECSKSINDNDNNCNKIKHSINLLNVIYSIQNKYIKEFIDFLDPIWESYSKLLYQDSPLFGYCLEGIGVLVYCIDGTHMNLLYSANDFVNVGLLSNDQSIITNSVFIRSVIYKISINNKYEGFNELLDNFPSNYQMIVENCLSNNEFKREYYPNLLSALGVLISACSDDIRENHSEIVNEFISLYEKFASMPLSIDKNKNDDVEYANCFYSSLFNLASSILKCISNSNSLRGNRKFMRLMNDAVPPAYLRNLEFHFSNNSLISFYSFLQQYNQTFGARGNVILNRPTNYIIIFHGMNSNNRNVSDFARTVLTMVKKA